MKFVECVNNVSTFIDLKRLANEYVIDYKRLSYDELKAAMIKTAPQYYNQENVYNTIESLKLHEDESVRALLEIIIREVLLNEDNFSLCQKDLEDEVILYEQSILDRENEEEELFEKENIKLLSYVIDGYFQNMEMCCILVMRLVQYVNFFNRGEFFLWSEILREQIMIYYLRK